MDNSVTARFFNVISESNDGGSFDQILVNLAAEDIPARERNIGAEADAPVIARLERLTDEGDFIYGEFVRRQTNNKPPEANAEGLAPLTLSRDGGLGHACAFRYHRPTTTICLQNNPSGLSIGRVRTYLSVYAPRSKFIMDRVPTADAIERFRNNDTRSLEFELASPLNLPNIEGNEGAADKTVVEATRMLAEAFQGMQVKVEVSMGRHQEDLPKGPIESVINRLIPWKRDGEADLRKLRVKSKDADGEGPTELINFLEEFLVEKTKLDLPDDNPERNYHLRRDQLSLWHNLHLPYLEGLYRQ